MAMAATGSRTIKSAARVLEILEFFDQDHQTATVMDMSRKLSYPQSSTSELLRCLSRLGFLHYNRFRRTYSPTARVAMLGAWVNPSLFRGGPMLSAIDRLARDSGETVVMSTASNYVVQHIHVVHGQNEDAADCHVGDTVSLLHSPQGELLLSSYRSEHVRLALHRLNAEEPDPEQRVPLAETQARLAELRLKGWLLVDGSAGQPGSINALLPQRRGMDRLVLGIHASAETLAARGDELTDMLLATRDEIGGLPEFETATAETPDNVVPLQEPFKILSYHRHYV